MEKQNIFDSILHSATFLILAKGKPWDPASQMTLAVSADFSSGDQIFL